MAAEQDDMTSQGWLWRHTNAEQVSSKAWNIQVLDPGMTITHSSQQLPEHTIPAKQRSLAHHMGSAHSQQDPMPGGYPCCAFNSKRGAIQAETLPAPVKKPPPTPHSPPPFPSLLY